MIIREFDLKLMVTQQENQLSAFKLVQNDSHAYVLNIKLTDGISEVAYSEVDHATITFSKQDGTVVQGDIEKKEESLKYTFGTNELACPGVVKASIQLYGADDERITSARFKFDVVADLINPDAVQSTSEFPILQKLIQDVDDAHTEAQSAASIAQSAAEDATEAANNVTNAITAANNAATAANTAASMASTGETTRQTNETTRQSHETERVGAESARVSAESARITAESSRESEEASRSSAESARVTGYAGMNAAIAAKANQTDVTNLTSTVAGHTSQMANITQANYTSQVYDSAFVPNTSSAVGISAASRYFLTKAKTGSHIDKIRLLTKKIATATQGIIEIWSDINGTLTLLKTITVDIAADTPAASYMDVIINYDLPDGGYLSIRNRDAVNGGLCYAYPVEGTVLRIADVTNTTLAATFDSSLVTIPYVLSMVSQTYKPSIIYTKTRKTVIVDAGGYGDYISPDEAVKCEDAGTEIKIHEGVYDVSVRAFNKRVILIGSDRNKVILRNTDGRYTNPPLELSCGYIANLTAYAQYINGTSQEISTSTNGAYAMHCESNYSTGKTIEFDHVKLISDFAPAAGIGLRKDFELIINNGELITNQPNNRGNYATTGGLGALYFHDSIGEVGNQKITVINSILKSALTYAMCVYDLNTVGNAVVCEFIKNTLYSVANGLTNNIYWRGIETAFTNHFSLDPMSNGNTNSQLNIA